MLALLSRRTAKSCQYGLIVNHQICTGTFQSKKHWTCKYIIWFVESFLFLFVKSFGKNFYCRLVLPLFDLSWCMSVMYDMVSCCHCPNVRDDNNIHKWYSHCWHPVGGAAAHLRRASWKLTACAHWSAPHGVYSTVHCTACCGVNTVHCTQ